MSEPQPAPDEEGDDSELLSALAHPSSDPTNSRSLSAFPYLSLHPPFPPPSFLPPSDDAPLSWAALGPPPQPQRSESLPDWLTGLPSSSSVDFQPLPLELSASPPLQPASTDYFPTQPQFSQLLPIDALQSWTNVMTQSRSTTIAPHPSSAAPITATTPLHATSSSSSSHIAVSRLLRSTSSSSSASSSTSPSPTSLSPSNATSYSSDAPARRRYQRLTGLSHDQRLERRRQSHRELDAVRRQREAAAISRLEQLTASRTRRHSHTQQTRQQDTARREEQIEPDTAAETDEKGKRHRTDVLENSVQRMAELQHLVHQLAQTCQQQSQHIATLTMQLHSLGSIPHSTATATTSTEPSSRAVAVLLSESNVRRLVAEFGVSSLYSTLFAAPSVGLLLVDVATGCVVDVNQRLLSGGECAREDVIGRQVAPTYDAVMASSEWDSATGDTELGNRMRVRGGQAALMHSQYGATKEGVLSLYRGLVDQVHVVWRAQLGDAVAYELPLSSFVASRDVDKPKTVLVSLSLSEAKRI